MDSVQGRDSPSGRHQATGFYASLPPIAAYLERGIFRDQQDLESQWVSESLLPLIALIIGVYSVESSGILIFRDITKLTDKPLQSEGDDRQLLADYAPDRIVFSLKQKVPTEKPKEFALVSPFPFLLVPILSKPSYLVPP